MGRIRDTAVGRLRSRGIGAREVVRVGHSAPTRARLRARAGGQCTGRVAKDGEQALAARTVKSGSGRGQGASLLVAGPPELARAVPTTPTKRTGRDGRGGLSKQANAEGRTTRRSTRQTCSVQVLFPKVTAVLQVRGSSCFRHCCPRKAGLEKAYFPKVKAVLQVRGSSCFRHCCPRKAGLEKASKGQIPTL